MSGLFVQSVTKAINENSDNWEFHYYYSDGDYQSNKLNVYMSTRAVALGPEWEALQRIVLQVKHQIPYSSGHCYGK